jgi:alkanesulfonate monooxygenase
MRKRLRFHWSLSQAGDPLRRARSREQQSGVPALTHQIELCRAAEACGIDSVLMAIGYSRPDPLALSIALGAATTKIRFMIACRSGLISPTYFVQQINTASTLLPERICINMVCGHTPYELGYYGDFLDHDERYRRTAEFLTVCRALWRRGEPVSFRGRYYRVEHACINTPMLSGNRSGPEIFLGGNSAQAEDLAIEYGDCLWRFPDRDELLAPRVRRVADQGTEVGLLVSLITRPTRDEAVAAARALVAGFGGETRDVHRQFAASSDSKGFRSVYAAASDPAAEWLTPTLWTGAVPYLGAPAIALVGSYAEVAEAIFGYREIGVSQFLFVGWPDVAEMRHFAAGVVPLLGDAACDPVEARLLRTEAAESA